jgi:hypothetical protein
MKLYPVIAVCYCLNTVHRLLQVIDKFAVFLGEFVLVCTEKNFVVLFVGLICQEKLIVTRTSCNMMRFFILFLLVSVSVAIVCYLKNESEEYYPVWCT